MSYQRHPTIDHYLNKVRLHSESYFVNILGKKIKIFPFVMSPRYDRSSQIFISMMPSQNGKRFLEIGTGCGVISVFAAVSGAECIVATDINQFAVENAKENFKIHGIKNSEVLLSDLFENVAGSFDTIFFNAPFHGNRPNDILEYGTSDENYNTLKRFFDNVGHYLASGGNILLGFSNMGDIRLLEGLIRRNHFSIKDFKTKENGDWIAYFYVITRN